MAVGSTIVLSCAVEAWDETGRFSTPPLASGLSRLAVSCFLLVTIAQKDPPVYMRIGPTSLEVLSRSRATRDRKFQSLGEILAKICLHFSVVRAPTFSFLSSCDCKIAQPPLHSLHLQILTNMIQLLHRIISIVNVLF